MSQFDEIPTTKQAIITFKEYAEKQIKLLELNQKKMVKFLEECDRRLELMEKKDDNRKADCNFRES